MSPARGDQNSAIVRVCFIGVYVFASAARFNTVFSFFLQTRRVSRTSFFSHDEFFDINLK
jgi:hypothetical protein